MLSTVKKFFEDRIQPAMDSDQSKGSGHALHLASAALLIEMIRADHEVKQEERDAVSRQIQQVFNLDTDETRELLGLAEQEADDAVSLFQFTNLIDKQFPMERKVKLIEMLWHVAFADSHKDKHEEYLVRRVADLLHVPHREFIRARHIAEAAMHGKA